jgi:hypothetical protein
VAKSGEMEPRFEDYAGSRRRSPRTGRHREDALTRRYTDSVETMTRLLALDASFEVAVFLDRWRRIRADAVLYHAARAG